MAVVRRTFVKAEKCSDSPLTLKREEKELLLVPVFNGFLVDGCKEGFYIQIPGLAHLDKTHRQIIFLINKNTAME